MSTVELAEQTGVAAPEKEIRLQDYSLVGKDSELALEKGLADADWYTSPVSKPELRKLLTRKDGPAIRDSLLYFGLIIGSGIWMYLWVGTPWMILPMMIYGVLYASASDARWHESSHGTAFKTDWLNNAMYEVASFLVLRESIPWRWSHTRHHSDTIIVGRDPEIAVPRPPDLKALLLKCFNYQAFRRYFKNIFLHSLGKLNPEEATFIPEAERPKVYRRARIYVLMFAGVCGVSIATGSLLPFLFIYGPNLYGAWLMPIYGYTQHAGLAENVLDHRLNCRTVYMNPVHRFLYWNMNYHLEHHMFPLVPYHQLPRLHALIKDDCPVPYNGLWETYREIIPTVLRQIKDPGYHVKRELPETARPTEAPLPQHAFTSDGEAVDGWIQVCSDSDLGVEDVVRFDHDHRTFAVYRNDKGELYATDGICTHGNTHLADGLVKGNVVECPKHNGRFDVTDGSPVRPPVCVNLQTYPTRVDNGSIYLNLETDTEANQPFYLMKVKSNRNVATFIKELVLEPVDGGEMPEYQPGQYMQLEIPHYEQIDFSSFEVQEPFRSVWEQNHIFDYQATNPTQVRRNYSLATNPGADGNELRFNVRIATPPRGQSCSAGAGSSWVYNLKEGDTVTAFGAFGDFLIKPNEREKLYLGGGAGMAPLRSHLSHLFETLKTGVPVTYWYGARSKQEIFYEEYFRKLEKDFPNFSFHVALSEALPEDNWDGPTGYIHEVVKREFLDGHASPQDIDFYLCGPPVLLQAARDMLTMDFAVAVDDIAYDEF